VSAAAKDAELYLRRCRKLEGIIVDLLALLEYLGNGSSMWSPELAEQVHAAIAKAKAAL
jgi:hypothetical protein